MKLYTNKVVADWLAVTPRRVRQLRDEGVIQEKNMLHSSENVEKGIKTMCLNIRSRFLSLPAKLAPALVATEKCHR